MSDQERMAERPGKSSPSKIATILQEFMSGRSLNRFEAERLHDHCLHTTVASLEGYGIRIEREWERVPCLGGTAWTRVKRYWLGKAAENLQAAPRVLEALRGTR